MSRVYFARVMLRLVHPTPEHDGCIGWHGAQFVDQFGNSHLCALLVTGQITCFNRKDRYFAATFDRSSLASMNRANTTYLLIVPDGSFEGTADGKSMSCQSTAVRTELRFRRDSKYYTPPDSYHYSGFTAISSNTAAIVLWNRSEPSMGAAG
jgi:hypothetical protein